MRLRVSKRAAHDRLALLAYLARYSDAGAQSVAAQLSAALVHLAAQPESGTPTDMPGIRVLFVGKYPYKVFYRVQDDRIDILHIRHTARAGL